MEIKYKCAYCKKDYIVERKPNRDDDYQLALALIRKDSYPYRDDTTKSYVFNLCLTCANKLLINLMDDMEMIDKIDF